MNGFDLSTAQGIYLCGTMVNSVYYGSTLIWSNNHDYSQDYLTFTALEAGTFSFQVNDLLYSLDNGSTWTTLTAGNSTPQLAAGDKILWKQTNPTVGQAHKSTAVGTLTVTTIGIFDSTCNFNVSGNVMSLYYGDNFTNQSSLAGKSWAFTGLFMACTKLMSAQNLILPATTLEEYCYYGMFLGCTALTTAPALPATTLTNYCYGDMFNNCTSLTAAPELPATTLTTGCYLSMFPVCSSLNYIKCLATDISAAHCTEHWVASVAASGTFVKATSMSSWTTGNDGIPSGWTTQNA